MEQSTLGELRKLVALPGLSAFVAWSRSSASSQVDLTSWPTEVYLLSSTGTGPRGSVAAGSASSSASAVAAAGTEGVGSAEDGSQLAAVSPSFVSSSGWPASGSCSAGSRTVAVAATTG